MKRISGLDGIRAYAVLMVVSTHLWLFIGLHRSESPYFSLVNGDIGVKIFFVLSGLLITHLLYCEYEKNGRINIKYFLIRRSLRIFPVYYLFLITLFILGFFLDTNTSPKQLMIAGMYWFNHAPISEYNITLAHTWSLAVEEHFYLIWPPTLILLLKRKLTPTTKIIMLIIIIIGLGIIQNTLSSISELSDNYKIQRWTSSAAIYLFSGCIGGLMMHAKWWNSFKNYRGTSVLLSFIFLLGFFIDFWYNSEGRNINISNYLRLIGILSGIMWVIINQNSTITKILELRPIAYIGKVSYGIYLWQGFYLATGPGRQYDQEWPLSTGIGIDSLLHPGLILLCVTVPISYHFFEIRFLQYKEKFRPD